MASLILNTQIDTFLKVRYHRTQDILIYWRNNFSDSILQIYSENIQMYSENVLLWKHSPLHTPKEKSLKETDRGTWLAKGNPHDERWRGFQNDCLAKFVIAMRCELLLRLVETNGQDKCRQWTWCLTFQYKYQKLQ